MLVDLKKAFDFIAKRKRAYRFFYFFSGEVNRVSKKITKNLTKAIVATSEEDRQKYFKGKEVLYW